MESLTNKIKNLLASSKDDNKKQVALFLTQEKIDALDNIVKELTSYTPKRVNRNDLIEMAVDNLIESAPIALKEFLKETNEPKFKEDFDTIVCPSKIEGLDVFMNEKKWYYVRIDKEKINKIKWCALYVGAPLSQVFAIAKVKSIIEEENGKHVIYFDGPPQILENKIPLGNINAMSVRSCKFTTLAKIKQAKEYSDLN